MQRASPGLSPEGEAPSAGGIRSATLHAACVVLRRGDRGR
ncbi:hypothetical protein GFS60_07040 (plasmid) [Rhodococcus sp. WAY2]|nr:hypothetical protein GFS60_07040 [Rhodococcus sp. WAY2]